MYTIKEAAKKVHVEAHALRYWEEELGLSISRNDQGYRQYSEEDMECLNGFASGRRRECGSKRSA